MVNCLKDAGQSSRNLTLTNRTDMGKQIHSEDQALVGICDLLQSKVVLVASMAEPARSRDRACDLYSGIIAFCDQQLFSMQGTNNPLYRRICSIVAELFSLHQSDLCGKNRVWPKPQARAMTYLILHEKGCTLKRCSEIVGIPVANLNYAIKTLRREMDVSADLCDIRVKASNRLATNE